MVALASTQAPNASRGPQVTAAVDPLTEPVPAPADARARLALVDKLRGFVVLLMVLDHVRDFFNADAGQFSATDLDRTTAPLFATRWVTHLCAPTFVLLAGVAVFLRRERGGSGLSIFLLTRGLWLVALEVTVVTYLFNLSWDGALLQVIWALGLSMVLLAPLVALPAPAVLALGLVIVAGHDVLDGVTSANFGPLAPLWTAAVRHGMIRFNLPHYEGLYVAYPVLPWFGIMATGFGLGSLFASEPRRRDRLLLLVGTACLVGFALLRGFNHYGDPSPWTHRGTALFTALSFLNVSKYPPSLLYTLVTLGIALIIAPAAGRLDGFGGRILLAFGRVPLFAYLAHLAVARGAAAVLLPLLAPDRGRAAQAGLSLAGTYVAWLGVLLVLWPLSSGYARLAALRRRWWMSYI